jgi:DNA-3-methyladenine glycosylase
LQATGGIFVSKIILWNTGGVKLPVLPQSFFNRSALLVAPDLLGKYLVCGNKSVMITETEAYDGFDDLASHASKGKTARTAVMFGPPGRWYVYLIYGMYSMLNIVTGPESYPAAVLIRGVEGINGPGKITRTFGITREFNNLPATKQTGLYIEDRGIVVPKTKIIQTPRIGVAYAGPIWSQKLWRFVLES